MEEEKKSMAFPLTHGPLYQGGPPIYHYGLTKREFVTIMLLSGKSNDFTDEDNMKRIVKWTIETADEVIKQLGE